MLEHQDTDLQRKKTNTMHGEWTGQLSGLWYILCETTEFPKCHGTTPKIWGYTFKTVGYSFKTVGYTFTTVGYSFTTVGYSFKTVAYCFKSVASDFWVVPWHFGNSVNYHIKACCCNIWRNRLMPFNRKIASWPNSVIWVPNGTIFRLTTAITLCLRLIGEHLDGIDKAICF